MKHTPHKIGLALVGLTAITLVTRPAAAQLPAVSFAPTALKQDSTSYSLGYTFTTGSTSLVVTALGYINDGATGAKATHGVQIYQVTSDPNANGGGAGTAVPGASATVTTAGGGPVTNSFTYTPIAPVTLAANTEYEIVAENAGNGYVVNAQNPVYNRITFGQAVYALSLTPVFAPNAFAGNNPGNFGPNFQIAPEPSSVAAIGLGVLGLTSCLLRVRRRAQAA